MTTNTGQFQVAKGDSFPVGEEFEILLLTDPTEPGYSVFVPALPGCATQGDNWEEALEMARGAIESHLSVFPRPAIDGDEKASIVRDWTEAGFKIESASVWVEI